MTGIGGRIYPLTGWSGCMVKTIGYKGFKATVAWFLFTVLVGFCPVRLFYLIYLLFYPLFPSISQKKKKKKKHNENFTLLKDIERKRERERQRK